MMSCECKLSGVCMCLVYVEPGKALQAVNNLHNQQHELRELSCGEGSQCLRKMQTRPLLRELNVHSYIAKFTHQHH